MIVQKNIDVFVKHKVYNETEIRSRYEILLENYSKAINIEAHTAVDMVKKEYIPAISSYVAMLSDAILAKKSVCDSIPCTAESEIVKKLSAHLDGMYAVSNKLLIASAQAKSLSGFEQAKAFHDDVLPLLEKLRFEVDSAEVITADEYWPVSTYGELLFKV